MGLASGRDLDSALAGATGAVAAECAAEIYADLTLKSTFDEVGQTCKLEGRRATEDDYINAYHKLAQRSGLVGKFGALLTAALTKQNANIVYQAASNATDNNCIPHLLVGAYVVGSAAWTAYEIEEAYVGAGGGEAGAVAALKVLGVDLACQAVGGAVAKGAVKIGGKVFTSASAALAHHLDSNPLLKKLVGRLESAPAVSGAPAGKTVPPTTAPTQNVGKATPTPTAATPKGSPAGGETANLANKNVDRSTAKSRAMAAKNAEAKIFKDKDVWTASKQNGTRQTYAIFQRKDIDWSMMRTKGDKRFIGKTNKEAAEAGLPPQLKDGNFATLHHIGQNSKGPLAEASTKYHGIGKPGQKALHGQFGPNKPHPQNPIDRRKFESDRVEYWKNRIKNNGK